MKVIELVANYWQPQEQIHCEIVTVIFCSNGRIKRNMFKLCRLLESDCKINLPTSIKSSVTMSLRKLLKFLFCTDNTSNFFHRSSSKAIQTIMQTTMQILLLGIVLLFKKLLLCREK